MEEFQVFFQFFDDNSNGSDLCSEEFSRETDQIDCSKYSEPLIFLAERRKKL